MVIRLALEIFTDSPHVVVFDTAFHQTIPDYAHIYAIPYKFYTDHKIRRYGFHGTSHFYVAKKAAEYLHLPLTALSLITIHIGNGASITAIKDGRSIDTSMGLTPLEGLIMGTRSGDLDPAIIHYIYANCGLGPDEIDTLLNKESGLKGITGENDLRIIEENFLKGDPRAKLALQMYTYRIKKYIGAYLAILGKLDAIVFTAGVGENSPIIREMTLRQLGHLGILLDDTKNNIGRKDDVLELSQDDASIKILVIPTDEELEMSLQTVQLVGPK
jgi:acetate kinase